MLNGRGSILNVPVTALSCPISKLVDPAELGSANATLRVVFGVIHTRPDSPMQVNYLGKHCLIKVYRLDEKESQKIDSSEAPC